jgi:hypothetical protein
MNPNDLFWARLQRIAERAERELAGLDAREESYAHRAAEILKAEAMVDFHPTMMDDVRLNQEPRQHFKNNAFSDRSLTVLRGTNWFLDLYLWDGRDTGLHDHHFSGAFQVQTGLYHERLYRFLPGQLHHEVWNRGQLLLDGTKLLERGHVNPIFTGDRYIHQTYHPQRPAVTLCLRSENVFPHLHNFLLSGAKIGGVLDDQQARSHYTQAISAWNEKKPEEALALLRQMSVRDFLLLSIPSFVGARVRICEWWERIPEVLPLEPELASALGREIYETVGTSHKSAQLLAFMTTP